MGGEDEKSGKSGPAQEEPELIQEPVTMNDESKKDGNATKDDEKAINKSEQESTEKSETNKAKIGDGKQVSSESSKIVKDGESKSEDKATESSDQDNDVGDTPRPHQIVSVGTEASDFAFKFHQDRLDKIIAQIPPGWKVAIVSVVGAFRTGKSFLLSWFLRYLHYKEENKQAKEADKKWYETFTSIGKDGFDWRGGVARNTTGIWMWSHPYFVTKDGEDLAVLLVDTQGMFDNDTTMSLTTSIFGLSTLLSSFQIYNVDKRIQEDNLQQLALFSEYARATMDTENKSSAHAEEESKSDKATADAEEKSKSDEAKTKPKPFQRIEFLVRDWQHFDEEDDEEDFDALEKQTQKYLQQVIAERNAKDLQDTREQIMSCFETIGCFALPHPGFAVTKKKYEGDVSAVESQFLIMLDRFCNRVFNPQNLEPKTIRGRELTAAELGAYTKAYAELFASGAHFPEAATMLEATASANNTNAVQLSVTEYKVAMDRVAGPSCNNYMKPDELKREHKLITQRSLRRFDDMATFGNHQGIKRARDNLENQLRERFELYESLNENRNPLAGMETYLVPVLVGLTSYFFRTVADWTCSPWSSVCRKSSDLFFHVYAAAFCFLILVLGTRYKQIGELFQRMKSAVELVSARDSGKTKKD